MSKFILVLGPGLDAQKIGLDLLGKTIYKDSLSQDVYPLDLNNPKDIHDNTLYAIVSPNSSELNQILNLPDVKVVIQTHSIGEISRISGDMFLKDAEETQISRFTQAQHQYKRIVSQIKVDDNIHLVETEIGTEEGIRMVWDKALELKGEETPVAEEPAATEVPEAKEESFDDLLEQTSNEQAAVETPVPEEVKDIQNEPAVEQPATEETAATEPAVAEQVSTDPEPEFDPLLTGEESTTKPLPEKSEPVEPALGEEDFEKALLNSLEQAHPDTVPATEPAETKDAEEHSPGVPDEYPNVDQTVTYDPTKIFNPSVDADADALHDWGGSAPRFNMLYDRLNQRLNRAVELNKNINFTEFERCVFKYGEDQVAVPETHKMQYVEGARWNNNIQSPTTAVPIIMPIRNPNYGDAKYVGPECVSLVQNRMKIGCKLGVYLPHTGIYFIIVSPGDDQFLDALSIINNQRVNALRSSSGILLGNSNFYINRQVMNLFLDSIVQCSLAAWNREALLGLIDERDVNIMANALGASIYPDGYEYVQACGLMKENNKLCDHMTHKLVDLRRLIFVDNSRLSENQKIHAAGALKERTIKEIQDYKDASYIGFKKPYEITEGIEFVYRAQSAMTSIEAGEKWIKEIEAIVDNIIAFREDEDMRNTMIEQRINLTRIREYAHWVEEILVDGQPITDRAKINKLLNSLSRKKEVVEKVSDTLTEFQRLSSIAIVAVPRLPCEGCQQTNQRDLDVAVHLIPQDAVSRLFTLVRQRLS